LVFAKKHTGLPTVRYNDAVEEALCFGWVDSLMHPVDERFYKQLFTPRKAKSAWSQSNKERVERLRVGGLMTAAGEAAIARARETGTWDTLAASEALEIPPELRKALATNPVAKKEWHTYTPARQKQFLFWLQGAKREDTRAARIAAIVQAVSMRITPLQAYEEMRLKRAASAARGSAPDRRRRR
jgi:uncharacterized protein YdeI (YjbR/CyaY-like superfamily)